MKDSGYTPNITFGNLKGKRRCQGQKYVRIGRWGEYHQCGYQGKLKSKDGRVYCKTHLPENIKAKRDKEEAEWKREREVKNTQWARAAAERKFTEGLSTEQLENAPPASDLLTFWNKNGGK